MLVKYLSLLFIYSINSNENPHNVSVDDVYQAQVNTTWFQDGVNLIKDNLKVKDINAKAKGVILFLGDGMGISTVTAARILDGQLNGKSGAIGVNDHVTRGSCENINVNRLLSIIMQAEMAGLSTGIVTTTRVTHATPAVGYAHSSDRNYEVDSRIPENSTGCIDIARQLIEFPYGNGLEVVFGGGRRGFLPNKKGKKAWPFGRKDGRNLTNEWTDMSDGNQTYLYIKDKAELKSLDPNNVDHVLGLFAPSHMSFSYYRKNQTEQPSLIEMTEFAIKVLSKNPKGYFLLVEGGRIDHGHHQSKAFHALHETVELAKAVEKAVSLTSPRETLLLVTADHSHVFTMGGYPSRGNPIFGYPDRDDITDVRGLKYTTLGYFNGPGGKKIRVEPTEEDLKNPEFQWQSLVELDYESHGGEDVGIYARGTQAHLIRGVVEQNYIFHVMDYALCLSESKKTICREEGLLP